MKKKPDIFIIGTIFNIVVWFCVGWMGRNVIDWKVVFGGFLVAQMAVVFVSLVFMVLNEEDKKRREKETQ